MGFADMLIMLGIPYSTPEAVSLGEKVMKLVNEESKKASVRLARERGSFPNFRKSIWPKKGYKALRNATTTAIAPTGTISIIAGCSSGVEPIYGVSYIRTVMDNLELLEVNPVFEETARREGFYSETLMRQVARMASIQHVAEIPERVRKVFVTAYDIPTEYHIRMQAAFQKHTDNSITKTINFPSTATKEDVARGYMLAWELGCKGCTVYRDKSRKIQVLKTVGEEEDVKRPEEIQLAEKQEQKDEGLPEGFVATKSQMKQWEACPTCKGANLDFGEGCVTCKDCGLSACFI
jgi:ribonucleoside-diphosphate reductase alpha chain